MTCTALAGRRPAAFGTGPTVTELDEATAIIWAELPPDIAPWVKVGIAYTVGELAPSVAMRVLESAGRRAEIIGTREQLLALAHSITDLCQVIPAAAGGEAEQRPLAG